MRDLYKLALLVPIVIVLAVFLFRMAPGDVDIAAGDGIEIQHQGEDFIVSAPGSSALAYSRRYDASSPPAGPTLTIDSDPTIDVTLDYPYSGDVTKPVYTVEVDVPSLQAAVGAAVVLHGFDDRNDPTNPGTPFGYRETRELRVDVEDPLVLKTAYDDAKDRLRLTVSLDGGTAGEVVTSTGPNSNPIYADVPTELPTGATDEQVLTWDASAAPAAPIWADLPKELSVASLTLSASDIASLDTTRIELIPTPPAGHYILPHYAIVLKTGGPSTTNLPSGSDPAATRLAWQNTQIHLALTSSTGGLYTQTTGGPDCIFWRWLHNGDSSGWLIENDYQEAANLMPATAGSGPGECGDRFGGSVSTLWTGSPLTILGLALDDDNGTPSDTTDDRTAQQVWDDYTANLGDLQLRVFVYYETLDLS